MSRAGALLALTGIGIAWGATIPLTKIAVSSGHRPRGLIFWQWLCSAAVLAVVALLRRLPLARTPSALRHYLVICVLGTLLPNTVSYLAIARLPAGVMAIVIASVPMFALLIALGLRVETLVARRLLGVLAGAAAVVLLSAPEASLPDPGQAGWVLLALLSPLCYGAEGNYLALKTPRGLNPIVSLLGACLVGAVLAAPLAWLSDSWVDLSGRWGAPERALLASSLFHALAYTGYIWLVGAAGAVFASQIAYVVTLAGVLLSAAALGEAYSSWVWAALALMIAGLALVRPVHGRA